MEELNFMEEFAKLGKLKNLPNVDESGGEFERPVRDGSYNKIDYSDSVGEKLMVTVFFANIADLSGINIKELVLKGNFNFVNLSNSEIGRITLVGEINFLDVSRCQIKSLDQRRATIGKIYDSEAKIGKIQKRRNFPK